MNYKQKITIVLAFLIIIINSAYAYCANDEYKKVYMIILNRTTLEDMLSIKTVKKFIEEGSLGLMNTRGTNNYSGPESYITINTSSRSYSNYGASMFFNIDENPLYKKMYLRRTGNENITSQIANVEQSKLLNLNRGREYYSYIGALGDNLHRVNLKTAVFGNSDTADAFIRTNCLIPMDSKGLVDYGNVDNILIEDNSYPYGLKTDYQKILKEIKQIEEKVSFIVIEAGDISRLNRESESLNDKMYNYHKDKILQDVDNFINELVKTIDRQNSRIIIISPNSTLEMKKEKSKLSPLVIWGEGVNNSILYSETTKRSGIISNIDIAPTITSYLGASNYHFTGNEVNFVTEVYDKIEYIKNISSRTNFISNIRYPVLSFYCIFTMVCIILISLLIFFKLINNCIVKKCINICLITIIIIPFAFHIISAFHIIEIYKYILMIIFLLAITLFLVLRIDSEKRLFIITGLSYITIVLDILSGGMLIKYSVMGYDPIIGARYYGIGNEMVGVFIPSMYLTVLYFLNKDNRYKKIIVSVISIFSVITIAHPKLGANLGGTIALLFSSIFFLLIINKIKLSLKRIIILFLLIFSIVLSIALFDISINNSPSHIGKVVENIWNYGFSWFANILIRKILMNIKLIRVTIWTKVIYITFMTIVFFIYHWKDKYKSYFKEKQYVYLVISSCIFSQIIGFLVNDSGVLIASIISIYIAVFLLYDTINYVSKFKKG